MIRNPFKYGKEVSGDQFYDRNDVFQTLYRRLSDGSTNVVMYAPRRYGKTSLVKKVLAKFASEGTKTILPLSRLLRKGAIGSRRPMSRRRSRRS